VSGPLVLCYHAVSEDWPSEAAVRPSTLERQIRRLLRRGYRPRTLSAALEAPRERTLAVTFDDAFGSVEARALPLLSALGVPATVFVPTDYAGTDLPMSWSALGRWVGSDHEDELHCMSWEQLRRLAAAGWEIGSHTCSHPPLTELGPEEASRELVRSGEICEQGTGARCEVLAYPYGIYDSRTEQLARAAGYRAAVGLNRRILEPCFGRGRFAIPREGIYREAGRLDFAAKTSRLVRRIRRSRLLAPRPAH
jgi:peptidoglycan/xylan/chitin deacetylase (PgdA/CDA1 family)